MRCERVLWRLRQRIWDYDGTPNEAKALRVLRKLAARSRNEFLASLTADQRQARDDAQLRATGWCCPADFA